MNLIILYTILASSIVISILALKDGSLMDKLKFNPSHIANSKEWHRFFSYGFIHADYVHLGVNMWVLWIFGKNLIYYFTYYYEQLANLYFVLLYIPALAISVIPSYFKNKENIFYSAVGASGAVSAIVYAAIMFDPNSSLYLFLIPFPIPAWLFGIVYLIYSYYLARKGNSNIGHSAHFWGAVYGLIFMLVTTPDTYIFFFDNIFR